MLSKGGSCLAMKLLRVRGHGLLAAASPTSCIICECCVSISNVCVRERVSVYIYIYQVPHVITVNTMFLPVGQQQWYVLNHLPQ